MSMHFPMSSIERIALLSITWLSQNRILDSVCVCVRVCVCVCELHELVLTTLYPPPQYLESHQEPCNFTFFVKIS